MRELGRTTKGQDIVQNNPLNSNKQVGVCIRDKLSA